MAENRETRNLRRSPREKNPVAQSSNNWQMRHLFLSAKSGCVSVPTETGEKSVKTLDRAILGHVLKSTARALRGRLFGDGGRSKATQRGENAAFFRAILVLFDRNLGAAGENFEIFLTIQ